MIYELLVHNRSGILPVKSQLSKALRESSDKKLAQKCVGDVSIPIMIKSTNESFLSGALI
jgi:hypothetical protein